MILCLDIGNSHILGGVFAENEILFRFRYATELVGTSDQFGLFLHSILANNKIDPSDIRDIALCSVVPSLDYTITAAFIKYFDREPFVLKAGVKTGLKLKVSNPLEVGADRIADAIGAIQSFPDKNRIVVDFGTATTICAISKNSEYLGGAIIPGMSTAMKSLNQCAEKLAAVEIIKPDFALGKSTKTNIQSGIYYSQLGAIKLIVSAISKDAFPKGDSPIIISTGGFAHLFDDCNVFTANIPDLALYGLKTALAKIHRK